MFSPFFRTLSHPKQLWILQPLSRFLCNQSYCPVPNTSPNFSAGQIGKRSLKALQFDKNWIENKEKKKKKKQKQKRRHQDERPVSLRATFVISFFWTLCTFSPSESIMYQCQWQWTSIRVTALYTTWKVDPTHPTDCQLKLHCSNKHYYMMQILSPHTWVIVNKDPTSAW